MIELPFIPCHGRCDPPPTHTHHSNRLSRRKSKSKASRSSATSRCTCQPWTGSCNASHTRCASHGFALHPIHRAVAHRTLAPQASNKTLEDILGQVESSKQGDSLLLNAAMAAFPPDYISERCDLGIAPVP